MPDIEEMQKKVATKRSNLGKFASLLKKDLDRISKSESDNQEKLTSLYRNALDKLGELETVDKRLAEIKGYSSNLKAEMDEGSAKNISYKEVVRKFDALFPTLTSPGTDLEKGYMKVRATAASGLKPWFGSTVDLEKVVEAVDATYSEYANWQLTRIDEETPTTKILELRKKQKELHDCLQYINEEWLPKAAAAPLFQPAEALRNIDAKIQEQIQNLLSSGEETPEKIDDVVASASKLLKNLERLHPRLDKVKENFVSHLRAIKEDLTWLKTETGESIQVELKVDPERKTGQVRTIAPQENEEAGESIKSEESKKSSLRKMSSASSASSTSSKRSRELYSDLITGYVELLLENFDKVSDDDGDLLKVSEALHKLQRGHENLMTHKDKKIVRPFKHAIVKISGRLDKLSAIATKPVMKFEKTDELKGKGCAELKKIIENLLNQEQDLLAKKSSLFNCLREEKGLILDLSDDEFKKVFEPIGLDEVFQKFKTEVVSISAETSAADLKAMVETLEKFKEIRRTYKWGEVNSLIEKNKNDWQSLLKGSRSKMNGYLKVNDVQFSQSELNPLTEDASMEDIETEEKRQKDLGEKLGELLAEQVANREAREKKKNEKLEELIGKGAHLFTEKKAEKVWRDCCHRIQGHRLYEKTAEKLCHVKGVLNILPKELSDKASDALITAMQAASTEILASELLHTRGVEFNAKIKNLYREKLEVPDNKTSSDINEQRLESEKVTFLQNIIDDVFDLTTVNEKNPVLPQLLAKEQKRNKDLLNEIESITDLLKNHCDNNATGKTTIESVVKEYKKANQDLLEVESNEPEPLFNKIVALRANNRQAVPVLEKIKTEADDRTKAIGGFKRCLIDAKHFFQYVYRKYFGGSENKTKSFADYKRLSIYNDISNKAEKTLFSLSDEQEPSVDGISHNTL